MPLYSCDQVYTKELYYEYSWCAYYKISSYKKIVAILIAAVVLFAVSFVLSERYIAAAIILISIPIYPVILKKGINKRINKAWESNVTLRDLSYHVDFYDTYLETTSENGSNKTYYDKLFGILETEHILALMIGNNQGNVFNKEQMSEDLITFLKTKAKVIK